MAYIFSYPEKIHDSPIRKSNAYIYAVQPGSCTVTWSSVPVIGKPQNGVNLVSVKDRENHLLSQFFARKLSRFYDNGIYLVKLLFALISTWNDQYLLDNSTYRSYRFRSALYLLRQPLRVGFFLWRINGINLSNLTFCAYSFLQVGFNFWTRYGVTKASNRALSL